MTRIINTDPSKFAEEALQGFAMANARYVKPVYGGVVRSTKTEDGKVALVVGGGSGHYPAFAGWVGQGFADGAVAGNIFASPSAQQAYSVCKAANRGAGVLIGYGKYAGDTLQFGQAAERLKSEGIDTRQLEVTDDIASAPHDKHLERRGIAGDLPVFKVTAAACETGRSIDEVEEIFNRANDRVRSLGIALAGCTLPGADGPLFTVPDGKMAIGLGIHGEPGIDEMDLGSGDEIGAILVDGLLEDRPDESGTRVVAVVNGLGSQTYEELFLVYRSVAKRLQESGIEVVEGQVDEFVTSLDMAGLSLTLLWLDDVLEPLWFAACDTPAFRRGAVGDVEADTTELNTDATAVVVEREGGEGSKRVAGGIVEIMDIVTKLLKENERRLGDIDAVAGDGDHGIGMSRGSLAGTEHARSLSDQGAGAQTTLVGAGDAWSDRAGGTSGALWGAMLTAIGQVLRDDDVPDAATQVKAVAAARDAVERLGGAKPGDKTMMDSLAPFADTFSEAINSGSTSADALRKAASAAQVGADSTQDIAARLGRAKTHGDKSIGTPDAGAVSLSLIADAVATYVASR